MRSPLGSSADPAAGERVQRGERDALEDELAAVRDVDEDVRAALLGAVGQASVELDAVGPELEVGDQVAVGAGGVVEGVGAGAAGDGVVSQIAKDQVVARTALDRVVALSTAQRLVPTAAEDGVIAQVAVQDVAAGAAPAASPRRGTARRCR